MKPLIPSLLAVVGFCALHSLATAQSVTWKSAAPGGIAGTEYVVDDLVQTSGGRVYGIAWLLADSKNSLLLKRADGGNWSTQQINSPNNGMWLYDIDFTGDDVGYAAGTTDDCGCGVILKTTTGGTAWTSKTFPGHAAVNSVQFVNATTGFASGSKGLLLKTTNGGDSWSELPKPDGVDYSLQAITFPTASVGYMAAQGSGGIWATKLLKTTDGGTNWTKIQDYGDETTAQAFRDLHFFNKDIGVGVGRLDNQPTIFRTVDGGKTWTKVYSAGVTYSSPYKALHSVAFSDDNIGYAAGDFGLVLRTVDGGLTWKIDVSGVGGSADYNAIGAFSESDITVGGAQGALIYRDAKILPTAILSSTELNFGTVESGTKEMSLTISAGSSAGLIIDTLQIVDIPGKPSGFTIVGPTSAPPFEIAPGNPLEVTVRFQAKISSQSNVVTELYIHTNDAVRREIHLPVHVKQGNTGAVAATLSSEELDFGLVGPSRPGTKTLTITSSGTSPLRVDALAVESLTGQQGFEATTAVPLPATVPPGGTLDIQVSFRPEDLDGVTQASLTITTNAGTPLPGVFLMGTGTRPVASVSAQTIDFGNVSQEDHADRTVTISAGNSVGLRLDTLYIADPGSGFSIVDPVGSFPIWVEQNQALTVAVRFQPGTAKGSVSSRLLMHTDAPSTPEMSVDLSAVASSGSSGVADDPASVAHVTVTSRPQPTSAAADVMITIPHAGNVTVTLFDALGRRVTTLHDGTWEVGEHNLHLDVAGLPSGRYYCVVVGSGGRGVGEITVAR